MSTPLVLALDLGTTSAKTALFDEAGRRIALYRAPLAIHHLPDGGVEQDPEEFVRASRKLLDRAGSAVPRGAVVACAGIACQRSTIVVWERGTGRALGPAVSWMDRRAAGLVAGLSGSADRIARLTGLRLSPHYGAAHLARRLASEPALARAARRGAIVAGPVASFVLSRIARTRSPAADPTLAQRTLLFDPWRARWDPWLCGLFGVPSECLPEVRPSAGDWGEIVVRGRPIPVRALAGDQQAAAAAFDLDGVSAQETTRALVHYGTGAFVLWPAADPPAPRPSAHRARGSVDESAGGSARASGAARAQSGRGRGGRTLQVMRRAASLDPEQVVDPARASASRQGPLGCAARPREGRGGASQPGADPRLLLGHGLLLSARADVGGGFYAEGTVNAAGAALDALAGWIGRARLRRILPALDAGLSHESALLVPAFAGLGAPHWDEWARPVLFGAGPGTGPRELALAALAGIAHRVTDILEAGESTLRGRASVLLSGPLAGIPALARLQADLAGRPVRIVTEPEATLLGIARIALQALHGSTAATRGGADLARTAFSAVPLPAAPLPLLTRARPASREGPVTSGARFAASRLAAGGPAHSIPAASAGRPLKPVITTADRLRLRASWQQALRASRVRELGREGQPHNRP